MQDFLIITFDMGGDLPHFSSPTAPRRCRKPSYGPLLPFYECRHSSRRLVTEHTSLLAMICAAMLSYHDWRSLAGCLNLQFRHFQPKLEECPTRRKHFKTSYPLIVPTCSRAILGDKQQASGKTRTMHLTPAPTTNDLSQALLRDLKLSSAVTA